jgi:hypothetical protein
MMGGNVYLATFETLLWHRRVYPEQDIQCRDSRTPRHVENYTAKTPDTTAQPTANRLPDGIALRKRKCQVHSSLKDNYIFNNKNHKDLGSDRLATSHIGITLNAVPLPASQAHSYCGASLGEPAGIL